MKRTVEGLDKLKAKIAKIPAEVRAEMRVALEKSADSIVSDAKAFAPRDDGVLLASIKKAPGDHELSVRVMAGGPTTTKPVRKGIDASYDYAVGMEFGNAHVDKQPFFFPAVRLNRRSRKARMTRAINKALKKVAGDGK